jgi:CRISPR/Cas system CMR-associated protein Cmr5 small subunit
MKSVDVLRAEANELEMWMLKAKGESIDEDSNDYIAEVCEFASKCIEEFKADLTIEGQYNHFVNQLDESIEDTKLMATLSPTDSREAHEEYVNLADKVMANIESAIRAYRVQVAE